MRKDLKSEIGGTFEEQGFTLVELLVSIVLLAIVVTAGVSVFMTVIRNSTKATILEQMRYEGLRIMDQMEREIKRAKDVNVLTLSNPDDSLEIAFDVNRNDCVQYTYYPATAGQNSFLRRCEGVCGFSTPGSCPRFTDVSVGSGIDVEAISFLVIEQPNRPKNVKITLNLRQNQLRVTRSSDEAQIEMTSTVTLRTY